jgi:four helix bundle protein
VFGVRRGSGLPGAEKEDMEIFEFESLRVYQKALDFIDKGYEITKKFPAEERFVLVGQFRQASVSIALNTAEGTGGTKMEFNHFLKIARRSVRECVAVTEISFRQQYIDAETKGSLRADCVDMSKMLNGLIKSLTWDVKRPTPNAERLLN